MAQELVRVQLAPASHLRGDPHVLRQVEPGDAVAERPLRLLVGAAEVLVGDPGDAELGAHRDPGPDRRARVHLEQLELRVAWVAYELDVREPGAAGCAEEPLSELVNLRVHCGGEDSARPEAKRPLPHLAPDDAGARLAVPGDVGAARPDVLVRVRDELLDDRVEAVLARTLPAGDGRVEIRGDERLL